MRGVLIVLGAAGMLLLLLVIIRGYAFTRRPAYRNLIMLNVFSMFVFALIRYWPYSPWY